MLDAGAGGDTRKSVGTLLHFPGWSPDLVAALHAQTAALAKVAQITVSNHVFEQTGLRPTQQTLDDLTTAYGADLRQFDFSKEPAATDEVNHVISGDTDGMIPTLFGQPLDPDTQTVLANAILLDAKWAQPFTDSNGGPFHTAGGKSVTAQMMSNGEGSFASRTASGWQSVVLPYEGNELQAVALLPPTGADACTTPSSAQLSALTSGTSTNVAVTMPKLDLTQTLQLTDVLAALGLPLTGDYSGLGGQDNKINEVVQKVVMKVDEQGTKAAAATGIGMTATAVREPNPTVTFDRPYLLLLEDTATQTPLFLASVANPASSG
jgi:serpin B